MIATLPPQICIPVADAGQAGEARRAATRFAQSAGLDETTVGRVALVASELANNAERYGASGRLFVQALQSSGAGPAIEIIALDSGPGIADIGRSLRDGYSTGGTPGTGLGAVRRLSTLFDVWSLPERGTAVVSRISGGASNAGRTTASRFRWGAIALNAPREEVCGDTWRVIERDQEIYAMVADGLGHGPQACEAATQAAVAFEAGDFGDPAAFLEQAHRKLVGTRGAAIAAVRVSRDAIRYAGLGNIAGFSISADRSTGLVSQNGTLGVQVRRIQEVRHERSSPGLIVMHSDGLSGRWSLGDSPGLARRHPALIAAVLLRDCLRGKDDATVVVIGDHASD
jgi:anti-sigma regulatory factor (Ser/Thr protein kinase)